MHLWPLWLNLLNLFCVSRQHSTACIGLLLQMQTDKFISEPSFACWTKWTHRTHKVSQKRSEREQKGAKQQHREQLETNCQFTLFDGHLSSIFISLIVFSLIFSLICSMCTCKFEQANAGGANSAPRRAPGQRVDVIRFGLCTENQSNAGNARAFNKLIRFDWKWLLNTVGVWRLLDSTGQIKTRLRLRGLGRSLFPTC